MLTPMLDIIILNGLACLLNKNNNNTMVHIEQTITLFQIYFLNVM